MTLLMGVLIKDVTFNVSDRLLTQQLRRGGTFAGTHTFDDASNKTIVFIGGNGILSISFTGTAYMHAIPTDQWVAQVLARMELPSGDNYKLTIKLKQWKNVGHAFMTVINELNKIWSTLDSGQQNAGIDFLVTGWQKTKKGYKNIVWRLGGKGTSENPFKIRAYKYINTLKEAYIDSAGVNLTYKEEFDVLNDVVKEAAKSTPKDTEKKIVEHLRTLAINRPTVGTDCISVVIMRFPPYVTIEYFPDPNKTVPSRAKFSLLDDRCGMIIAVGDKDSFKDGPPDIESAGVFFCPWIIEPNGVTPPSSIVGTKIYTKDETEIIKIIGPTPPKGIIGGMVAQARPKKP